MIILRKITPEDLADYEYWKRPSHAYHQLNGPYFKKKTVEEFNLVIQEIQAKFDQGNSDPLPRKWIISNTKNDLIGEVSWYWKSEETLWLEIGITIFNDKFWKKGIGYQALVLFINQVFEEKTAIVRIGLTTWSGNLGMIRLAEKLGMQKEAEYRKARIVDGKYYNSISYGILREEWNTFINTQNQTTQINHG